MAGGGRRRRRGQGDGGCCCCCCIDEGPVAHPGHTELPIASRPAMFPAAASSLLDCLPVSGCGVGLVDELTVTSPPPKTRALRPQRAAQPLDLTVSPSRIVQRGDDGLSNKQAEASRRSRHDGLANKQTPETLLPSTSPSPLFPPNKALCAAQHFF